MAKFGVAVVGCGSIAHIAHFPSIQRTPEAELIAVCDLNEKTANEAKEKFGAKRAYTDYKKMYEDSDDIDAVIIATPNNVHRNQACLAARAGLNVIVEKPLTVTADEAWDIVNECREHGVKLMVGCDRRFWTHNQWAKDLIEDGVIGDLKMSRTSLHEHWHNYQNHVAFTDFRLDCSVAGGAAVSDTGAHASELLTWLHGCKVKRGVGQAQRVAMPDDYTLCDDLAMILMEFEDGTSGFVSCNRFSPAVSQSTDLWGDQGTIHTTTDAINPFQSVPMAVFTNKDYSRETLPQLLRDNRWPELFWVEDWISNPVRNRWVPISPPRSPSNYDRMCAHFMECLAEDKEPLVSGEDGARSIEVMCGVFKSMETGAWVDLPLKDHVVPPNYTPLPKE